MKYHFKVHRAAKGYWAQSVELPSCQSQGDTMKELCANLEEALNLYLGEPEGSKAFFPDPLKQAKLSRSLIAIDVDPKVAFAATLRKLRLKRRLTQHEMKDKLGIKHLSAYQQ